MLVYQRVSFPINISPSIQDAIHLHLQHLCRGLNCFHQLLQLLQKFLGCLLAREFTELFATLKGHLHPKNHGES